MNEGPITRLQAFIKVRPLATCLALLSAAATAGTTDPIFGVPVRLLVPIAAVLLYRAARSGEWADSGRPSTYLAPLIAAVIVALGPNGLEGAPASGLRWWSIGAVGLVLLQLRGRFSSNALSALAVTAGTAAVWYSFQPVVIDVWHLHVQASERLLAGLSPYSGLAVENGSPAADPGSLITGYPYPLVSLLPFAAAAALGLDPRLGAAAVWVVSCMTLVVFAARRRYSDLAVAALVLTPAWVMQFWTGWTEPVSVSLLIAASTLSSPLLSAVMLGLMLSSKQYLIVLAPLLLAPVIIRGKRLAPVITGLLVGVVPGLIWDPTGFIESAIAFHLQQPPRGDAMNPIALLTAAGWTPPGIGPFAVLVGLATAMRLRTEVASMSDWILAGAACLAVTFTFTPQAFPNYWFLVLAMVLVSRIPSGTRPIPPMSDDGI